MAAPEPDTLPPEVQRQVDALAPRDLAVALLTFENAATVGAVAGGLTYPASTGRNFSEILRAIDALQLAARHPVATPANWQPGDACMLAPELSDAEAAVHFPKGWIAVTPYLLQHEHLPLARHQSKFLVDSFTAEEWTNLLSRAAAAPLPMRTRATRRRWSGSSPTACGARASVLIPRSSGGRFRLMAG